MTANNQKLMILLIIAPVSIASAQTREAASHGHASLGSLPKGVYDIDGNVISTIGRNCRVGPGMQVRGVLDYPGLRDAGMTLFLRYVDRATPTASRDSAAPVALKAFVAFPIVPHAGLTGWTRAAPAATKTSTYVDGSLLPGSHIAQIVFSAGPSWKRVAGQPNTTIEIGDPAGCEESINASLSASGR